MRYIDFILSKPHFLKHVEVYTDVGHTTKSVLKNKQSLNTSH